MPARQVRCVAFSLFVCFVAIAQQAYAGAMAQHMQEAIRLNQARLPMYEAISAGASRAVSKALIRFERVALPGCHAIDTVALPFQKKGIPIVVEDFISMDLVPDFVEEHPDPAEPLSEFERSDGNAIARRLRQAYKRGGFAELNRQVFIEEAVLEKPRAYHHLMRHMLHSIRRLAVLAPKHAKLARSKGMPSTAFISEMILESHLITLWECSRIDAMAAPLQARRIPIIRQDVPDIPTGSEFYDGQAAAGQH